MDQKFCKVFKHLVAGLRSLVPGGKPDLPGVEDRRRLVRLRCDYPVLVKLGDTVHSARITDISPQGLKLVIPEVPQLIKRDTPLHVSYRPGGVPIGRQRLRCRVIWSRKPRGRTLIEVGLAYDDDPENLRFSWVQIVLQELGFDERRLYRRRAMRIDTELPVRIRNVDAEGEASGDALNVGIGGILCRLVGALPLGTTVRVLMGPYKKLAPLQLTGRVVSLRPDPEGLGTLHGIRFLSYDTPEIKLLGDYVIQLIRETYGKD